MGNQTVHSTNQTDQLKVVITGNSLTKKTKILYTYTTQKLEETYIPTVFDNYNNLITFEEKSLYLSLWDTAGQEDYDRLRPLTYPDTSIFIIFFSLCNRHTYDEAFFKWVPELWLHSQASIVFVGVDKDKRDEDPNNPDYINVEALDACEPFAVVYHEIDANNLKSINHLFNVIVPEVYFNRSYDQKKVEIQRNIKTYHSYVERIDQLKSKIQKLEEKKEKNVKEIEEYQRKIDEEKDSFFKNMFPKKK